MLMKGKIPSMFRWFSHLIKKKVSSHACDCKNISSFCQHKTALLIHIAKGTKITHSVVLGCLTGLRFSDFSVIKSDDVRDGMLYKRYVNKL